jgi:hypothetical protein
LILTPRKTAHEILIGTSLSFIDVQTSMLTLLRHHIIQYELYLLEKPNWVLYHISLFAILTRIRFALFCRCVLDYYKESGMFFFKGFLLNGSCTAKEAHETALELKPSLKDNTLIFVGDKSLFESLFQSFLRDSIIVEDENTDPSVLFSDFGSLSSLSSKSDSSSLTKAVRTSTKTSSLPTRYRVNFSFFTHILRRQQIFEFVTSKFDGSDRLNTSLPPFSRDYIDKLMGFVVHNIRIGNFVNIGFIYTYTYTYI